MSNVLMAFLGITDYLPCNYFLNNSKINNVRFIQEAMASLFCKDWNENDRIVIFLTEEAKNVNMVNNGHKNEDGKLHLEGLEKRLKSLGLKIKIDYIDIPSGQNEKEIWNVFEKVFEQINEKDDIIFDITHAWRSQPMLAIIILNYAKILRDIKIKGLYYGAFEVLGPIREVKKMNLEDRNVPIFDLTSFVSLFDWTNAINNFLTYGDAEDMDKLAYDEIKPILIDTQGKDENVKNLRWFNNQLRNFTKSIQTCRGPAIIKDFDFDRLKKLGESHKNGFIKPMNPLLGRIASEIKSFNNNDPMNCYAAVKWCIDHNLTQQGYTFLREAMITEIVEKEYGMDKITDRDTRAIVETAINMKNNNQVNDSKINKEDLVYIINLLDDDFVSTYNEISQRRNDINHAGFRENSMKPDDLINDLEKYYEKLKIGAKYV